MISQRWGRRAFLLGAAASLTGCATDTRYDSVNLIEAARYMHPGPPALTLYTMVSTDNGSGAHTSLMVNGSQRVIFDPAGSVSFSGVPENADILYGITPDYERAYASAHARRTFYVVVQRKEVPAAVAEQALQRVLNYGAVVQAFCAQSTSTVLSELPGFESIRPTFLPNKLRAQFGALPGVTEEVIIEDDEDDKSIAVARIEATLAKKAQR